VFFYLLFLSISNISKLLHQNICHLIDILYCLENWTGEQLFKLLSQPSTYISGLHNLFDIVHRHRPCTLPEYIRYTIPQRLKTLFSLTFFILDNAPLDPELNGPYLILLIVIRIVIFILATVLLDLNKYFIVEYWLATLVLDCFEEGVVMGLLLGLEFGGYKHFVLVFDKAVPGREDRS
jgi:hypothetical protein